MLVISRFFPYRNVVFTVVASAVLGVAALGALLRHQELLFYSLREQSILAQFASQMPQFDDHALVLLFDDQEFLLKNEWTFSTANSSAHFNDALKFLYQDPAMQVRLCYPDKGEWGPRKEACILGADGVTILYYSQFQARYPYDKVIAFRYDATGKVSLLYKLPKPSASWPNRSAYNQNLLIDSRAAPPSRVPI